MIYRYLAIEGNIGAGKTSLAHLLASASGARLVLEEFSENTFLPRFYQDRERYAFPVELSFLSERFTQLKNELQQQDLFAPAVVADYFIGKCQIFAKNNLQRDEYELFLKLYEIVETNVPKPDLLVYLYLGVDRLQQNIRKRGRSYEQEIQDEYLQSIQEQYLEFIRQHTDMRVLLIDTSDVDFVHNAGHAARMKELVFAEHPAGITRVKA